MVEAISQLLLAFLLCATSTSTTPATSTDMPPQEGFTRKMSRAANTSSSTTEKATSRGNGTSGASPWCPVLEQDSEELGVMGRLARLDELQKMKELVEAEIRAVKASISEELLEERKDSSSSYNAVAPLKTAYRGKGVHIMVIPVAEAVEKQLMVILRDKEEVLTEVLDVVERNLNMMHETVDFIEDLVSFGQNQVSVVFGEHSAINRLFMSGVAPFLENMDDIFATISSLVSFKRGNLNSFLSEDYNRTELLQNIRNVAFDNILPAKVDFVATLLNNSESIRQDMDSMMHHMGSLIRLKQSVVDSVSTYIEQNRHLVQKTLGREFRFDSFFMDLQTGNLFRNVSLGPFVKRGLPTNRVETKHIIRNYISLINPRLPLIHSSMKEMLVDMEEIRKLSHGSSSPHLVDSYLASKVADILMDSVYKLSVRNGDVLLSTSSPPVKLGSRCGLHFQLGSSQVALGVRRTSHVALTKGITLGTGRPASLDIIASAWLDMDVSLAGQGTVTMAKHLLTKCFNKVSQKANLHLLARARTYVSLKVSLTHIRIASRPVETELFVPPEVVGRVLPHIVVRFQLNLNSELTSLALDKLSLSECHVDVLGVAVFSYCNLLQRVVLNQGRQALRQALPLSSGRAMRQIERAVYRRFVTLPNIPHAHTTVRF
jgi:hypothetical protein